MAMKSSLKDREYEKFVETDSGNTAVRVVGSSGSTTLNVETSSVDVSGLVGKSSGGDFTTAYTSATTITCSNLPNYHSTLTNEDIVSVVQIDNSGNATVYGRDDQAITVSGNVITISGASFSATDSFVVYTNIPRHEQVAETTVPASESDGTPVRVWYNDYGQQVIYGANLSEGTHDVSVVNDALAQTIERISDPLLNAVTSTGASDAVDVSLYNKLTFHIVASSVTTGGTMKIQGSLDGSNYAEINSTTVNANGTTEVTFSDVKYKYVRANLTARTDGTYTVTMIGGN